MNLEKLHESMNAPPISQSLDLEPWRVLPRSIAAAVLLAAVAVPQSAPQSYKIRDLVLRSPLVRVFGRTALAPSARRTLRPCWATGWWCVREVAIERHLTSKTSQELS